MIIWNRIEGYPTIPFYHKEYIFPSKSASLIYFTLCLSFARGKFLGGGKNLPLAQADGSANRRPTIFPSTGGAAEPEYQVF